ncbi:MAG TPA: tetratricopeptide repeat protein [Tepidisphaeraceae bacterium]|nr:tetratricopeptide repeat protein [Tepidisphaeraceae bacterium]
MKKFFVAMLAVSMLAGCTAIKKQPNVHEKSAKEWNEARAKIYYGLAKQQYQSEEFDHSRQTINQALTLEPKDVQCLLLSAQLWIENGQLEAAERQLNQVREVDPKNAEADYLSGIIYQRWQLPADALRFYTSANTNAPAELAYLLARAEMLVTLDHQGEALALLQSKAQYFEHSAALRDAIGQLLVDRGDYASAIEMFRQASILANDEDLSIRERLGLAMYYAKHYGDASDVLSSLAAKESYASRADILLALGDCDLHIGKYHDALNSLQAASRINADSPAIWLKTAQAALELDDLRWAELAVHKAIQLRPGSAQGQILLGYIRLKQNRLQDALRAFVAANKLDPHDSLSVTMTGFVYEKSGMKKQAAECYSRALQLQPGDDLTEQLMRKVRG